MGGVTWRKSAQQLVHIVSIGSSIQEALSVAQQLHWLGITLVCQLTLAEVEQTDHKPHAAQTHQRVAQAIIGQVADPLTDPALREQWFDAAAVRRAFAL